MSVRSPVVIGGGIVGLATAVAMAQRGHPPVVLEAEEALGQHQTGHNSGVIHSGLYYRPGSLKAKTCADGLKAMYRFCAEEGVPHRKCGKLVVALNEAELPALRTLEERGRANGVTLTRIGPEQIREYEPAAVGIAGLFVEDTGVVDYRVVVNALAAKLLRLGGEVKVRSRVSLIRKDGNGFIIGTPNDEIRAEKFVNCAGLQSDRVAKLAGLTPRVQIIPFRGEYYTLRPDRTHLVRTLIYPVPDPALPFLGVHLTRGIDGVVEAGPNAVLSLKREGYSRIDASLRDMADMIRFPGFWRMAGKQWRSGLDELRRSFSKARFTSSLQRLVPSISEHDLVPGGSGVRAQAVGVDGRLVDDFEIQTAPGMVHVLNAPSPAATASLAIGREIATRILGAEARVAVGAESRPRAVVGF